MNNQNDIKIFDDLSLKYSTWVIKYCSSAFEIPLFLIWYTDTDPNSTDKLLTFKSGKIFAVNSLTNLKSAILSSEDELIKFENLYSWLENFNDLEVTECITYDLVSIENEINKYNLDDETIEGIANFLNLFGDFIYQDERNAHLQVLVENELINETWDYFYDYIFWPRFSNEDKFEKSEKPPLLINTKELLVKLKEIICSFDVRIQLSDVS